MANVTEIAVSPGDDVIALIQQHKDEFAELRVGGADGFLVARAEGPVRPCGDCYACCVLPGIDALKKHPNQTCKHLDRHRCSIYPTRPHACQTFYCSWAFGNFEESDQPSKIGVVVGIFPHQGVLLAGMMVDSKKADMRRAWQIFAELALLFPHVQMVIDDEVIYVLRAGDIKPRKGKIMPRPRGDYEGTHYVLEDR